MRHSAPMRVFFWSSKSKFPAVNFGSTIEVRLEYVFNRWSDQPAGGVGQMRLIPRIGGCLIFLCLPIFFCLSMTIPPPQDVQATNRSFDSISPPFSPQALKCPNPKILLWHMERGKMQMVVFLSLVLRTATRRSSRLLCPTFATLSKIPWPR